MRENGVRLLFRLRNPCLGRDRSRSAAFFFPSLFFSRISSMVLFFPIFRPGESGHYSPEGDEEPTAARYCYLMISTIRRPEIGDE